MPRAGLPPAPSPAPHLEEAGGIGASLGGDTCLQGTSVCHQGTSAHPNTGSPGWSVHEEG